ncbi:hypothetical protein LSAT2_017922 [Lamellibrachia satsuma]|nr:hypothetical protein LSAT2_017922 [Lamellibrachia satsuma]
MLRSLRHSRSDLPHGHQDGYSRSDNSARCHPRRQRLFFAVARDGLFPEILAMIHVHYLTPWPSVWLTCLLSVIYIVVGNAVALIEYLGFIAGICYVIILACVLYLRWKRPHAVRSTKKEKRKTETEMGGLREERFGGSGRGVGGEWEMSGDLEQGMGKWRQVMETAVKRDQ